MKINIQKYIPRPVPSTSISLRDTSIDPMEDVEMESEIKSEVPNISSKQWNPKDIEIIDITYSDNDIETNSFGRNNSTINTHQRNSHKQIITTPLIVSKLTSEIKNPNKPVLQTPITNKNHSKRADISHLLAANTATVEFSRGNRQIPATDNIDSKNEQSSVNSLPISQSNVVDSSTLAAYTSTPGIYNSKVTNNAVAINSSTTMTTYNKEVVPVQTKIFDDCII